MFGIGDFPAALVRQKCALVRRQLLAATRAGSPRISVVIPAYRDERNLLATLRSLAQQTHPSFEVIVVSNGELVGNATHRIAEACGARVLHSPLPGIARARQQGLEAARGAIVVSTDADTLHPPGWLHAIERVFDDPRILCGAGTFRARSSSRGVRAAARFLAWTMCAKSRINPRLVTGLSEANSFFRRDTALAAGGYDVDIRVGEGIRLFRRFHRPGTPIVFGDPGLVVHTSARRIEKLGALRWFVLMICNTLLQLFGRTGLDEEQYPDVR